MSTFATQPIDQHDVSIIVDNIEIEFRRALMGDVAYHGSGALHALHDAVNRRDVRPLTANEFERLTTAFDTAKACMSKAVGSQLDDVTLAICWYSVRKMFAAWGNTDASAQSSISRADMIAWVRIARNCLHNASLLGEIDERTHQGKDSVALVVSTHEIESAIGGFQAQILGANVYGGAV